MKKVFSLEDPKKKPARLVEAAKNTITKYLKRERRKQLPENVDYVDFKCKFGTTEEEASPVHVNELFKAIDTAEQNDAKSLYVEVIPVAGVRKKN